MALLNQSEDWWNCRGQRKTSLWNKKLEMNNKVTDIWPLTSEQQNWDHLINCTFLLPLGRKHSGCSITCYTVNQKTKHWHMYVERLQASDTTLLLLLLLLLPPPTPPPFSVLWYILGHGLPNLLLVTFSVPSCHLPFLYLEQIYGILPTSISSSTSGLQHGPASSFYIFGDLRIIYLATWWAHCSVLKIQHHHKFTRCPHCI